MQIQNTNTKDLGARWKEPSCPTPPGNKYNCNTNTNTTAIQIQIKSTYTKDIDNVYSVFVFAPLCVCIYCNYRLYSIH